MDEIHLSYTVSGNKISSIEGHNRISVTFSADGEYKSFECRATKAGEPWGVGVGTLIASFSQTPADTDRTFEIYDDLLVNGDGNYQITMYMWFETAPRLEFTLNGSEF